jgi:hypothetical protein
MYGCIERNLLEAMPRQTAQYNRAFQPHGERPRGGQRGAHHSKLLEVV